TVTTTPVALPPEKPVIREIGSKGGSAGEVYAGRDAYVTGTGFSNGKATASIGGQSVVLTPIDTTTASFVVPKYSMYPASLSVYIVNNAGLVSNSYSVTVTSIDSVPQPVSSVPTVEFVSAPTLTLQYVAGAEATLVGTATVRITTGSSAITQAQIANILQFNNASGSTYSNGMVSSLSDERGLPSTSSIPANTTQIVVVTKRAPARELFAGAYTMKPAGFQYLDASGIWQTVQYTAFKGITTSNTVVIVGETSPYLSNVTVDNTGLVRVSGARLDLINSQALIDGIISLGGTKGDSVSMSFYASTYNLSVGLHSLQIINSTTGNSNRINFAVTSLLPTVVVNPVINVLTSPTLKLQYDSLQRESGLVAGFSVKVTAGTTDYKLYKFGAWDSSTEAFSVALNNTQANGSTVNPTSTYVGGTATDNGTYWTIKAGQNASFNLSATLSNPNTLFAGSYYATLSAYKLAGGAGATVTPSNNSTNLLTIIGERAPYITSVISDTDGLIRLTGARLDLSGNQVVVDGSVVIGGTKGDAGTMSFAASTYNLSVGTHYIQINNTQTGNSNKVGVVVVTPVATPPTVEVVGMPTLGLQYDSSGKESSMVANYTVKITAGIQALSFPSYVVSCGGSTPVLFNFTNSVGQYASYASCANGPETIPAGTSATYTIKLTANPNQIFSGAYTVTLQPIVTSLGGTIPQAVLVGNIKTNTLTIVGERAPYITYAIVGNSGTVDLLAYRLNFSGNNVSFGAKSLSISATPSGSLWIMNFKPSQFGITTPGVYPLQISTSEGASNIMTINVLAPVVSAPSNQSQLAGVAGAFTQESQAPVVSVMKYVWNRNLEIGSSYRDDVVALQDALTLEGVYTGEITGGFYTQTYLGVKALQSKYGISTTGYVGPETRAKLNSIYGN
ncbi:MAG: peptidoglycan-binding protein, partial [Minisyncoccia bacterium]